MIACQKHYERRQSKALLNIASVASHKMLYKKNWIVDCMFLFMKCEKAEWFIACDCGIVVNTVGGPLC